MLKKYVNIVVVLSLVVMLALSGCGGSANNSLSTGDTNVKKGEVVKKGNNGSDKKFKIVVMPKLVGITYFNTAEKGAKKAGEDLGVDVIYTGPTKSDAAEQVKMIEDLISKGVDCIAVAPNDSAALTPVLKKAKNKGILIMDWDTPAEKSVVDLSIHQIHYKEYAQHLWDAMVKEMGTDSGEYAVMTGSLAAANLNNWINLGLDYAKQKYPNLKLVTDKIPTDEKQQLAYQKTLELVKAYPNLKGIIAVSAPTPIGAAQAIQEKGLQDKIALIGAAAPNDSKSFLADGSMDVAILWDPAKLGYLTVYLAKQKLEQKEIIDGMEVPNVGKIKVESDGKTVIMGPSTDFTKENASNYDF